MTFGTLMRRREKLPTARISSEFDFRSGENLFYALNFNGGSHGTAVLYLPMPDYFYVTFTVSDRNRIRGYDIIPGDSVLNHFAKNGFTLLTQTDIDDSMQESLNELQKTLASAGKNPTQTQSNEIVKNVGRFFKAYVFNNELYQIANHSDV